MNHHILHILASWFPRKDQGHWLLATVIRVKGSSYRKPGAMMLFSDSGEQLGLVSGGCLENDVLHQARKCWLTGRSRTIIYDMQEEGELGWRLGIGCGGEIELLLQPVTEENSYLLLDEVLARLSAGETVLYSQSLQKEKARSELGAVEGRAGDWFSHTLTAPVSLGILGGGPDALPVANIAASLGWQVRVNDPRASYARPQQFSGASTDSLDPESLPTASWYHRCAAIIVMHHQVTLDANALQCIVSSPPDSLQYLALLGPTHRTEKVLHQAKVTERDLPVALFSPAGLDLGGELPESIALSMLAQAHAVLHQRNGRPLKETGCITACQ